tara:strand:- start:1253 stop:1789 length:537 start_codon:yes stop_codon:yes gene_type:complete
MLQHIINAIKLLLDSTLKSFTTTTAKPVEKITQHASGLVSRVSDVSLIKEFEGYELIAYKDIVGVWTIGYGHTKTAKPGMKITQRGAEELLRHDLAWVEAVINKYVKVPLKQNQYDAVASLIYNVGGTAFSKSTILRKLNANDFHAASLEFKRWNKAGGHIVNGLVRRREAERVQFVK